MSTEGNAVMMSGASWGEASLFVAAAHDLKSPLALLRQLALSLEAGGLSPVEVAELARRMALTSERALRLTTDLTQSTRLHEELFGIEPLNLALVARDVVAELQPLYAAKGRRLTVRVPRQAVVGLGNRDLLRRVLCNFADNALHYSGEGDAPVVVRLSRRAGGRVIRLAVRDYGPAIPPSLWQQLEQRLGVSAQPLHSRPGSSGLGLYIAGQFASAMEAQIGAVRHRDGATFYIDLQAVYQQRLL